MQWQFFGQNSYKLLSNCKIKKYFTLNLGYSISFFFVISGFVPVLENTGVNFNLVRLRQSSAIGAAYLAARDSGLALAIDFENNVEALKFIKSSS